MLSAEFRRDLAITVGTVLLLSGVVVVVMFICGGKRDLPLVDVLFAGVAFYALFVAGPFAGWILAAQGDEVVAALWVLVPPTVLSIWPAVGAARATTSASRRRRLALAGFVWLFSSFLYLVLIWI